MLTDQFPSASAVASADGTSTSLPSDAIVEELRSPSDAPTALAVVALPAGETAADAHDARLADAVKRCVRWVGEDLRDGDPPLQIPLYGTHVVWTPQRAAVIAPPERLPSLRAAVAGFTILDGECRDIERSIAAALEWLDDDAPLAFGIDEHDFIRRGDLTERYRTAISLRRRLAMIAPAVTRAAPQPPTFAGQIGERLRDRTRLAERLEHAVERADLLERVYSACGDRVGDYVISRRHATLEWVIILVLVVEVVLVCVDLLAAHQS